MSVLTWLVEVTLSGCGLYDFLIDTQFFGFNAFFSFLFLNSGQMALCQKTKIVRIYETWSWSNTTTWNLLRDAFSFHTRRQVGETICKQNFTCRHKSINLRKKDIVECCRYLALESSRASPCEIAWQFKCLFGVCAFATVTIACLTGYLVSMVAIKYTVS